MDNLTIKSSAATDNSPKSPLSQGTASALAGLAASFHDLLHKTGLRVGGGLNDISDKAGISAIGDRAEAAPGTDDYGRRGADDGDKRFDNAGRADERTDGKADARPSERDTDSGRDRGADHRDQRGDNGNADRGREHSDGRDSERGDSHAARDDGPKDGDSRSKKTSSKDSDGAKSAKSTDAKGGDGDQTGAKGSGEQGSQAGAVSAANAGTAGAAGELTNSVLGSILTVGEGQSTEGQSTEKGAEASLKVLAGATENTAAKGVENISQQGAEKMSEKAVENTTKLTPTSAGNSEGRQGNHQSQGGANANTQAQTGAQVQSAVKAEAETGTQSTTETQAAGLAKAIGEGNRAQVKVTVQQESQNLTSRPGQALSTNSAINSDTSQQSGNNRNAGNQAQNHNAANQTPAQQAQAAAVQNNATQTAQAQTSVQAGTDARGLAQTQAMSTNAGTNVHSGGGEGGSQSGTSNVASSQQAQQTQAQHAAEKAAASQRPVQAGNSMVDQISVKISKAVQAGKDKITIQLRPANLGRVEVKIEMVQDNRMTALVIADKPETLDLLKSDSRDLMKALQDAGLRAESGDLNFNLRGQENQEQHANSGNAGGAQDEDEILDFSDEPIVEDAVIASDGTVISNGRIDVRA